jgi:zinc transporter 5/7
VISGRPKALGQTALASAVTAGALFAGRQWLLLQDVGVFWLLVRVLACGGIAAFGWAAWTDQLKHARRKSVEVRMSVYELVT